MDEETQPEPRANRIEKGSGTVTLKMSIGKKKLHSDRATARMFCNQIIINGKTYCRPHLMERCHLCEVDYASLNEEVQEERDRLGLRSIGDARLNEKSDYWGEIIRDKQMSMMLESESLKRIKQTDPVRFNLLWRQMAAQGKKDERALNDRFLADIAGLQASQCCYWKCQSPSAPKLLLCTGCRIVKYCCAEHQQLDWQWEHKGECRIPDFLNKEFQEDRARNLAGNYETIDRGD
jgi:hypothetical protein